MTGIVIFTAGREDAYQDYIRSVKEGHEPRDIAQYLPDERIETVTNPKTDRIHVWGTSVESKWQSVAPGDIALVYRDREYIAQATVVETSDNIDLAEHLWRIEENPWDPDNPWRYLTFLSGIEEINIDVSAFNELVGYEEGYLPQGFSRVADHRIERLEDQYESVETAINELTGRGVRVHKIDDDDDDADLTLSELGGEIIQASSDGARATELEQLVAKGFSRLGFDANWIQGGDDTDVEIISPIHAVIEVKARSNGVLQSPDAARIQGHQDRRDAEHAIVVGPGFAPAAIEDAVRQEITLLSAEYLRDLLIRRETYGIPPETIAGYLIDPGAFQDDRLDQIDDRIHDRLDGVTDLLAVVQALERADLEEGTADRLRLILKGMYEADRVPTHQVIEQSLHLLAHPSIGLVEHDTGQYQLTTTAANATALLQRFGNLIVEHDTVSDTEDNSDRF